jgi:uroporphyrinogen decarboxylase
MRQAGRYLPEYRKVRTEHSFMELVRSPSLCTEVALQPLRRYDLDATIVFSDILVIPDAVGAGLSFETGDGPKIAQTVRSAEVLDGLNFQDLPSRLSYVYEAVAQLRQAAPEHAVFGFCGAPWTLYCYMVEGGSSHDFATARALRRRIGLVAGRHALHRPLAFYAWIHFPHLPGANVSKLLVGGKNPGWAKNMKKPTYGI